MNLVIVESPAKAKTINNYLGSDYKVIASFGHIRELPSKDGSVDTENNFAMNYVLNEKGAKSIKEMVKLAKESDVILLATDPDREGEAISWHVMEALKEKKGATKSTIFKRIVFNEITKKAVLDAVANPREVDMNLVYAQQARLALDYLVGFNLSPVLWRKLPGSRSAGRVQSVALRLVCEREEEIEKFIVQKYFQVTFNFANQKDELFSAKLTHFDGKKLEKFDIKNTAEALDIVKLLKDKKYNVATIDKKQISRNPQLPFTTSSLQQEASRRLGFGASKTMKTAQKLYEGIALNGETVGLITYMRTDGVSLADSAVSQIRDAIQKDYGDRYLPEKPRIYKTKAKNAQEAHEAIRPTNINLHPKDVAKYLDKDQLGLYELIWKRTMACQMSNALFDQVVADIDANDKKARARAVGTTMVFDGFFKAYNEQKDEDATDAEDENKTLPILTENEDLETKKIEHSEHQTEPPARYSEASLVKKLEELGIGRPSTYASIISVIQDREYVTLQKKRFIPEEKGRIVSAFLTAFFPKYVEYDFTAELENELDVVSAGEMEWTKLLDKFWKSFHENVEEVLKKPTKDVIEELTKKLEYHLFGKDENGLPNKVCPECKVGELGLRTGKFGAFIACSTYPTCKYTKALQFGAEGDSGGVSSEDGKSFGIEPMSGKNLSMHKGPYGFYLQLDEENPKTKPKRSPVPKEYDPSMLTVEQATALIGLPREVGDHPETGKMIKAGIGRFGPFLYHDSKYVSIPKTDSVLEIGLNRAVDLIASKSAGSGPLKVLQHPSENSELAIYKGRYGPYIKYGKMNVAIPKSMDVDSITLNEVISLIAKAKDKKK